MAGSEEYETPLHELCALARSLGLHVDMAIYAADGSYESGSRISGAADPMASVRAGVRALRNRATE